MNYDEFAFFNQQLAGMLRSGIPLEGALRQLTRGMGKSAIRGELESLEAGLKNGVPLGAALELRKLPDLYRAALQAGAQTGSVPSVLTLLADHYTRLHAISTRLKGLMVYPLIIVGCSLALSVLLSFFYFNFFYESSRDLLSATPPSWGGTASLLLWVPSLFLFALLLFLVICFSNPRVRRWLRWHFPGAKEASLGQAASMMSILLSSGAHLDTSFRLLAGAEKDTHAELDIARWRTALEQGKTKFSDIAVINRVFPPLFVWLVAQGGEDLAAGFRRAAEIYHERAANRADILLYAAMPLAVVVLGLFVLGQTVSVVGLTVKFIDTIGG